MQTSVLLKPSSFIPIQPIQITLNSSLSFGFPLKVARTTAAVDGSDFVFITIGCREAPTVDQRWLNTTFLKGKDQWR